MCLSVPMKVVEIRGQKGVGDIGGVTREIDLRFLSQAKVGDYVMVHAGFALQILDQSDAQETLSLLREIIDHETSG